MNDDRTKIFKVEDMTNYMITEILLDARDSLNEKGYNGINQIVGYLASGDLAYLSNYKNTRNKVQSLDREQIIETLLKYYLKDEK